MRDGQPTRWARSVVQGGPLNLKSVDESGRVLYRVDLGPLGSMTNERAVGLVDRIFKLYTDVPTASIEFVNAGAIKDPATGGDVDVDGTNFGRIRSSRSFQNAIVFDHDGAITGGGGVLGFFSFVQLDQPTNTLREGVVVLNGSAISRIGEIPFLGVFTHEFGHFAGPLDHAQVNGLIASANSGVTFPPGFTRIQAFDLYAPFTETLYPFVFSAPEGSLFRSASNFLSSGFWVASLDMDTRNALSNIYPEPGYRATDPGSPNGAIEGRVLIRSGGVDIPLTGVNVIARRISRGPYPPPVTSEAFPGFPVAQIQLDPDGVPLEPPDQDRTDSLATATSAVTGLEFGTGKYRLDGLPPGRILDRGPADYAARTWRVLDRPLEPQLPIPVPEFYSGPRESGDSSDLPADFEPIVVTAGTMLSNIDIILNGISNTAATQLDEREPNDKKSKAQRISLPAEVSGRAAYNDPSVLRMDFVGQDPDKIEDLYRFTLDVPKVVYVLLEPIGGTSNSDLDMYLFDSTLKKKKVSIDSSTVAGFSAGPTASEVIGITLAPGTYYVGVSAFAGTSLTNVAYRLRVLMSQ